jgi:hypothetical protein
MRSQISRIPFAKAKAAGVEILVSPYTADHRAAVLAQFPGGYIAEIHSPSGKYSPPRSESVFDENCSNPDGDPLDWHAEVQRPGAVETAPSVIQDRSYKLLREDEDWSFLRDKSLRMDFCDPIKYIPLRKSVDDWYMTIGGEAREVWEQIGNDNWGQSPYWNGYLNERYMPYFDLHYGTHVRTFIELKSGLNSFRRGGPRPIDEKKLDFQSAFLELSSSSDSKSIQLRIGRHELEYGSGCLIDVREGPNVRLSFDGIMVKSRIDSWQVDGFALRPDEDNPGFFDNAPESAVSFWGVYATRSLPRKTSLDLYYLGLDRKAATFQRGTAQEVRQSLGARISRPIATEHSGWDYDDEGLLQFGTFGSGNIRAWTIATETGYRFPTMPLKPRFSVKADISSGDHPSSNNLGTFNPLFPKGNYFGVLATTGPGPTSTSLTFILTSKRRSRIACLCLSTGFFSGDRAFRMASTVCWGS